MNAQLPLTTSGLTIRQTGLTESVATNPGILNQLPVDRDRSFQSSLMLFETLLSYGQVRDPRVILQALNAYITANQQPHGIALFDGILAQYASRMDVEVLATYRACLGVLRATYADHVSLARRIGWVRQSFRLLEMSLSMTQHTAPIAHWAAGMVYAQVPVFFGKKKAAYEHLEWLAQRPETEPVYGFYREVYHQLAKLYRADGDAAKADHYLHLSGFQDYAPKSLMMGWFTNGPQGTAMTPTPVLNEIVQGRVFALFGFGFSDIYFVLSENGKDLIAIDAGTHPHSIKAAHEFLLSHHPDLPKITTAFITHSHWDHIGGHEYLRRHNPDLKIYGRNNFAPVVQRVVRNHSYSFFRGVDFDHKWVESYAPTHPVTDAKTVTVGGTEIFLIPVTGGETEDAMLIHMPGLKTVFVGDIVMPWYGEPWVNEGFVTDAADAIGTALACKAKHVLHGHHPLTFLYGPENLRHFREIHRWLVEVTQIHIANGYSAKDVIRLNLVPAQLLEIPDLFLTYVSARDTIILRTAGTMTGIWREDRTGQSPEGLDTISATEHGRMLEKYLGLTGEKAAGLLRRMIANGDNELALQFAVAAEQRFGATPSIIAAKEDAADRLRSGAQFVDPFKFTTYSEIIGRQQKPMPVLSDTVAEGI
jgi:glyoxylase-like metal-dependent hydrolase (beta-lactamase superfamily II)